MALTQGVKESLWLGELLSDIGATQHREEIRQTQCNNQEAIALTRNPEYHARTKHIDIQYHFHSTTCGIEHYRTSLLSYA